MEEANTEADAQETIFAIAEAMQTAQDKQTDKMLEMFKTMMQTMQGTSPAAPANPPNSCNRNTRAKCPNCGMRHAKPEDCWELDANKGKRPANWKPAAERIAAYNAAKQA